PKPAAAKEHSSGTQEKRDKNRKETGAGRWGSWSPGSPQDGGPWSPGSPQDGGPWNPGSPQDGGPWSPGSPQDGGPWNPGSPSGLEPGLPQDGGPGSSSGWGVPGMGVPGARALLRMGVPGARALLRGVRSPQSPKFSGVSSPQLPKFRASSPRREERGRVPWAEGVAGGSARTLGLQDLPAQPSRVLDQLLQAALLIKMSSKRWLRSNCTWLTPAPGKFRGDHHDERDEALLLWRLRKLGLFSLEERKH
uniref:Uncharacterized protein n=1 Tax=Geospiza parvula TaxID=87175 RepID=A0A8U8AMH4_GEOPR